MSKRKTCLVPGCKRPIRARGQCAACRRTSQEWILAGKTTEAELIADGMLLPPANVAALAAAVRHKPR